MPAIRLDGSNHARRQPSHAAGAITRDANNQTRRQLSHTTPHEASRRQQSRSIFMLEIQIKEWDIIYSLYISEWYCSIQNKVIMILDNVLYATNTQRMITEIIYDCWHRLWLLMSSVIAVFVCDCSHRVWLLTPSLIAGIILPLIY